MLYRGVNIELKYSETAERKIGSLDFSHRKLVTRLKPGTNHTVSATKNVRPRLGRLSGLVWSNLQAWFQQHNHTFV
jgi:hypothetical protein